MDSSIYFSCQMVIILLTAGLLSGILKALKFAFQQLRFKHYQQNYLLQLIGIGIGCWLSTLLMLSLIGFFDDLEAFPPKAFWIFLPPLCLVIYLLLFSKLFASILKVIPKPWLIYAQSFRIIIELMFWLGYLGSFVPVQMTVIWLNKDIIVGLTALMGGYFFFWRGRYMRFEAIIWNVFGLLLMVNLILLACFSSPSPFRVFLNQPSTIFLSTVPFIWIPGFFIPLSIGLHLFSLRQLIVDVRKRKFSLRRNR